MIDPIAASLAGRGGLAELPYTGVDALGSVSFRRAQRLHKCNNISLCHNDILQASGAKERVR